MLGSNCCARNSSEYFNTVSGVSAASCKYVSPCCGVIKLSDPSDFRTGFTAGAGPGVLAATAGTGACAACVVAGSFGAGTAAFVAAASSAFALLSLLADSTGVGGGIETGAVTAACFAGAA